MNTSAQLRDSLRSIDHKSYPAYRSLAGAYQFDRFQLFIDHVQGDPFASPSSLRVKSPTGRPDFPLHIMRKNVPASLFRII